MRNYYLFLYLTFIVSLWKPTYAQQHIFDAQLLTTTDGLANLATSSIFKDSKGFIWIGTKYGLNRYDGYTFKLYTKAKNGLKQNKNISDIVEDENGNLWLLFGSENNSSFNIFNPKTEKVIPPSSYFSEEMPFLNKNLRSLKVIETRKRIWISTQEGQLFLFQDGHFKNIFEKEGFLPNVLTTDDQANIWIGGGNEIFRINLSGEILETIDVVDDVTKIWVGKKEELWIFTKKWTPNSPLKSSIWLKKKGSTNLEPFVLRKDNQIVPFNDVVRGKNELWYADVDNHFELFNSAGEHLFDFHDLLDEGSATGFIDYMEASGNIWFTTPIGVVQTNVKDNPFTLIHSRKEALSSCRGITEDENGNIYFLNRHLYQWKPSNKALKEFNHIYGGLALINHEHLIWGGINNIQKIGFELDLKTNESQTYTAINSYNPYTLLATSQSGVYFVGQEQGLILLDLHQKKLLPFEGYNNFDLLETSRVYFLYKNEHGIWIATNNGIFLMTEAAGVLRHFNKEKGDLPFDPIRHIHEDSTGVFWLATPGGGIIRWQPSLDNATPSKSTQFTTENGLSDNHTYAIYSDGYDNLWIPSDQGLMKMNKTDHQIKTYTVKDGLPHNEFNLTSHYQAKDSSLYFGGLGGLIHFHPKDFLKETQSKTQLVFTNYKLLEGAAKTLTDKTKLLIQSDEIIFKPSDKLMELNFALLDFDNPENHNYAYKIEGYMDQWIYINENFIRITDLPYGDYRLKIKGKNRSNNWSNQELSLKIKVLKPFYLQLWFVLASILVFLGAIVAIVQRREYLLIQDRKRLEIEVRKRTRKIEKDKTVIEIQSEALKELDKAKTHFFSNITHEFRTPLTLIIGPLEQVITEQNTSTIIKRRLNMVLRNAKHMLTLINQLLDLSKIEGGRMKAEVTRGDIIAYTEELIKSFEPLAESKGQRLSFVKGQQDWETHFDKEKWDKILYNLLSNAIKFTAANQAIQLSLRRIMKEETEFIRLDVKDAGMGIEKEQLTQIFNRFHQVDSAATRKQDGTGIGLALVKELVELQDGEIGVSSEIGKGTSFEICLPVSKVEQSVSLTKRTTEIQYPIPVSVKEKETSSIESGYCQREKLELLIIEDNEEMREYIRHCIDESEYNITEASNGQKGIDLAQSLIPDLIISDVMMPEKNGFEVTKSVRETLSTSHIPLILLTAKASLESRLEGLKRGADAYLTKPFSPQELSIRIQKLIEIRRVLQNRYQKDLDTVEDGSFEQEDEFIINVKAYILENIDNPNLNGDIIGKNFMMSRVQLYRKLKALTNQSISDLVRSIRLQRATELIKAGKMNMSEIAYQTGFNSLSSFSNIFKKAFGKRPSEM
ncbi:MAG: response regulator [Saprospiraceae bacterium]